MGHIVLKAPDKQLRDLRSFLIEEPEFRGRVSIREQEPKAHELGSTFELLQVALGSGGAVAALAGIVVAWLNSRPGEISVRISRDGQEIEVSAKGVRSLSPEGVRELTGRIADVMNGRPPEPEPEPEP